MFLKNLAGQVLYTALSPREAQFLQLPRWRVKLHALALKLAKPNPRKGLVPPRANYQDLVLDAQEAQRLIDAGKIHPRVVTFEAFKWASLEWGVEIKDGKLRQARPGSDADLIWVLSMSSQNALKPVLLFDHPILKAPRLLDGSHRIIRGAVDGRRIDALVIDAADLSKILKPVPQKLRKWLARQN